jgi:hypothetical protein
MTHIGKELHMKTTLIATAVLIALMLTGLAAAQSPTMIFACVDAKGRLQIIPQGTSCGAKETLLTWPATPTTPTSFYERISASQPMTDGSFSTAVAFCDDPDDTATGGGHKIDGLQAVDLVALPRALAAGRAACARGSLVRTAGSWWQARDEPERY